MRRPCQAWGAVFGLLAALLPLVVHPADPAALYCRPGERPAFQGRLAELRDRVAALGQPVECAHVGERLGQIEQRTTTGLARYDAGADVATFTAGGRTWTLAGGVVRYRPTPEAAVGLWATARAAAEPVPPADAPAVAVWRRSIRCPVLYTHEVPSAAAFERFLVGLLRAGYRPTSLAAVDAALGGAIEPPRGCLVLSFDDGLLSQFEHALPVLRAQNAPAVFFVMPGFADGVHRYMTARELRALADGGMEVGAHTCNHANLPALARANAGAFLAELVDCRRLLERTIGRPVRYLAYPYGAVDAEVLRGVARAGYRAAFTTRPATLLPAGAPLLLPRVLVDVSAGAWPVVERLRALDGLSGPLGEGGPGLLPTPV